VSGCSAVEDRASLVVALWSNVSCCIGWEQGADDDEDAVTERSMSGAGLLLAFDESAVEPWFVVF
jgi:hypothetical protein